MTEREELQAIITALVASTPPERLHEAIWQTLVPAIRAEVLEAAAAACDDYFRCDGPLPSDAPGEYIRTLK